MDDLMTQILALRARQYFIARYANDHERLLLCQVMSRHGVGVVRAEVINGGYGVKFVNGMNHAHAATREIIYVYPHGLNVEKGKGYEPIIAEVRPLLKKEEHATE